MDGLIIAVSKSATHSFSKENQEEIELIKGLGVEGDVHKGATVQHLYDIKKNPNQPNLKQVHLLQHKKK